MHTFCFLSTYLCVPFQVFPLLNYHLVVVYITINCILCKGALELSVFKCILRFCMLACCYDYSQQVCVLLRHLC